jgi:hypothetical protein
MPVANAGFQKTPAMVLVMLLATAPQPKWEKFEMSNAENIALKIIELLEGVKSQMELLRAEANHNGWDARQLSIAITELEGSQLRLANARPE